MNANNTMHAEKETKAIKMRCPGSCGEFLQGWLDGSEKLISYAIDCFSDITLTLSPSPDRHRTFRLCHPRAWDMAVKVVTGAGLPLEVLDDISLTLSSQLPRGKGMASSTADLAVTAGALRTWLGLSLSPEILTNHCTNLEPTDSLLYHQLVLMDPLTGTVSRRYHQSPSLSVLVLEGLEAMDTKTFRKEGHRQRRQAFGKEMETAIACFEKGLACNDYGLMAEGCYISGQAHQYFYPHPGLDLLHELAISCGALGINVAHSGSTVGVLFEPAHFHGEDFHQQWHRSAPSTHYFPPRQHRIISGGVQCLSTIPKIQDNTPA